MDKDKIEGGVKDAGGKAKEAWGDATDNEETEGEGKADQAKGNVQEGFGDLKDKVKGN